MKNDIQQRDTGAPRAGSQPIRIMGFVDGDAIPASCYDAPYRLEPEKHDSHAYELLRDVMHRTRKVGLVSVMIEKKQALAAVIPIGRTLVLNVLRFASGLVPGVQQKRPAARPPTKPMGARPALKAVPPVRQPAVAAESRTAARMAPAGKVGEVIDLAVRRSTKRVQRPARPARTKGGVATLHEMRRKGAASERQRA